MLFRTKIGWAAAIMLCGGLSTASAQQPPGQPLYVPGFWSLAQEPVRREVDLVPEQEEKLRKIAADFQKKSMEMYAPFRDPNLSQEDRIKLGKELQEKTQALTKEATQQVKDVLLPHQVKAIEAAELRQRVGGMLQYPQALERLKLTDEQKEKLKKNRDALAAKLHQLQKEAFDEVLQVLSKEQLDELQKPWNPQGGFGQPARPIVVPEKP